MRTVTGYAIYKKTFGIPYPGEHWDGPFSERAVKKKFKENYDEQNFRIVKITYQAVTK